MNISSDQKLVAVIAVGCGKDNGTPHKTKSPSQVSDINKNSPEWYRKGVAAALLAPTAMNQQKFKFKLDGNKITAKSGLGFFTKVDLGIVKYHFEIGAGRENFEWK